MERNLSGMSYTLLAAPPQSPKYKGQEMARPNKTYHPSRLAQISDTCRERLQAMQFENPSRTLDEIDRQALPGMPEGEIFPPCS